MRPSPHCPRVNSLKCKSDSVIPLLKTCFFPLSYQVTWDRICTYPSLTFISEPYLIPVLHLGRNHFQFLRSARLFQSPVCIYLACLLCLDTLASSFSPFTAHLKHLLCEVSSVYLQDSFLPHTTFNLHPSSYISCYSVLQFKKILVIWCLSSFLDTMLLEDREWENKLIFMSYPVSGTELGILYMLFGVFIFLIWML